VVFNLPLDDTTSITSFQATNVKTGEVVKGILMEKQSALDKYSDTIAEGRTAYLLEENESSFTASCGLLGPQVNISLDEKMLTLHSGRS
jgi:hypothetical protein